MSDTPNAAPDSIIDPNNPDDPFVTIRYWCRQFNRTEQTMLRWKKAGILPPHIVMTRRRHVWRLSDAKKYVEQLAHKAQGPQGALITPPWQDPSPQAK